jgi:hypothetical protein
MGSDQGEAHVKKILTFFSAALDMEHRANGRRQRLAEKASLAEKRIWQK